MKKRVTKSIYCVYFSSHRFDFIQHDFHEQHTNTHKSANAKASEIHRHTQPHTHFWQHAPHPLTPTQSRILSDPQLHQQRTKSRLKRVKSCSCVLFKISFFLSSNNWTSSSSSHIFTYFAHTHHKPLRLQNTHMWKSGFEAWNERAKWQVTLICLHSHQHRHSIQRFSFFFIFRLGSNPLQFLQFLHQYFKGKKSKNQPTRRRSDKV